MLLGDCDDVDDDYDEAVQDDVRCVGDDDDDDDDNDDDDVGYMIVTSRCEGRWYRLNDWMITNNA